MQACWVRERLSEWETTLKEASPLPDEAVVGCRLGGGHLGSAVPLP